MTPMTSSSSSNPHLISMEDILRQHSIHELRDLTKQLEKEGIGKQTELQLMVGSTYHDFIQSADTIATMQSKSKQMNEQLRSFGKMAESIVDQTKIMLANASSASSSESAPVSKVNTLLPPHQHHFYQNSSQPVSFVLSHRDIASSRVWNSLDECDIYSACHVIVTAEAVLRLSSRNNVNRSGSPTSFQKCLAARAANLLNQAASSAPSSAPEPLLERCAGVEYLHQTVVDDCALLFLYGHCDPSDSARSMAGLAGLSLCSTQHQLDPEESKQQQALAGGELLRRYLEGTDLRLKEICKALRHGGRSSSGDAPEGADLETLTASLVAAVQLLQQTIFNVYLIFFKKIHSKQSSRSGGEDGMFSGFLVDFLLQCVCTPDDDQERSAVVEEVQKLVSRLYPQAGVLTTWRSWILEQTKALQVACVSALNHFTSAHDVARAQRATLQHCLHFSSPASEEHVALGSVSPVLAQGVGRSTVSHADKVEEGNSESQAVWNAACGLLLLPFTLTNASGTKRPGGISSGQSGAKEAGGLTLWSHVFRKPFTTQVEKMLKVSCREIFHRTKTVLVRTLVGLGGSGAVVSLDSADSKQSSSSHDSHNSNRKPTTRYASWLDIHSQSLEVKIRANLIKSSAFKGTNEFRASSASLRCIDDEWSWLSTYTGRSSRLGYGRGKHAARQHLQPRAQQRVATSAEIFVAAEGIRRQLENDISDYLLSDILEKSGSPEEQDIESSSTLARSLQIQSCELVGQILVLLRVIANSLSTCLSEERRVGTMSAAQKRSKKLSPSEGVDYLSHHVPDGEAALQSGLLLVSRLAWLLQTSHGKFLEYALLIHQAPAASSAGLRGVARAQPVYHQQQYMTSLEQLQSAFDIADTDGDGVITFAEAVEAVNALWISDDINTSLLTSSSKDGMLGPPSLEFLWFDCARVGDGGSLESASQGRLSYTMKEFRLVCAQMIPPPPASVTDGESLVPSQSNSDDHLDLESPVSCLHSSLSALVSSSLQSFTENLVQKHFTPSLLTAIQVDFPFYSIASNSITNSSKQSLLRSFRFSWKKVSIPNESDALSLEEETLLTPVQPSRAAFRFITALSQASHAAFLSVDTTQTLHVAPTCKSGNDFESGRCLADLSQCVLFSNGMENYLQLLTSTHDSLVSALPKASGDGIEQLFEDYCVQILFDLSLCEISILSSFSASSGLEASVKQCRDLWEQHVDPINWSLLEPILQEQVQEFVQKNNLFIPSGSTLLVPSSLLVSAIVDSSESVSSASVLSPAASKSVADTSRFLQLFPSSAQSLNGVSAKKSNFKDSGGDFTSKFSLLPLPLTSSLAPFSDGNNQNALSAAEERGLLPLRGGKLSDLAKKGYSQISSRKQPLDDIESMKSNGSSGATESKKGKGWFF